MRAFVRITRVSNEGFKYKKNIHENFYDYQINSIMDTVEEKYSTLSKKKEEVEGCFAHAYRYNENAFKEGGVMAQKGGEMQYYIYLPKAEIVYARNVKSDHDTPLVKYVTQYIEDSDERLRNRITKHTFMKIPLGLFIKRTEESYKAPGYANEIITEIFLTKLQIEKYGNLTLYKNTNFFILDKLGFIKIYK